MYLNLGTCTGEVEEERSEVEGHFLLHSELKASLGHSVLCHLPDSFSLCMCVCLFLSRKECQVPMYCQVKENKARKPECNLQINLGLINQTKCLVHCYHLPLGGVIVQEMS